MKNLRFKRLTALVLAIAMLLPVLPEIKASAAGAFAGGSGTQADPYLIETAAQLEMVRNNLTASYRLTGDIDLFGAEWTPIGGSVAPFDGTFDGGGYAVKNLTVNSAEMYAGFFGGIGPYATVKNLRLESGSIVGEEGVGGIAGYNSGAIINCSNTCDVQGTGLNVGGIAGSNSGTITDCFNAGAVTGDNQYVGGIAGYNSSMITGCSNTGDVESSFYNTGGLVGYHLAGSVTNSFSTGNVSGIRVGGLIGFQNGGRTENCYSTGDVVSKSAGSGGLMGRLQSGTLTNCYSLGNVTGTGALGGIAGEITDAATATNCYYNTDDYPGGVPVKTGGEKATGCAGLTTAQMKADGVLSGDMVGLGAAFIKRPNAVCVAYYPELAVFANGTKEQKRASRQSVFAGTIGENEDCYSVGDGTPGNPFEITTAEQLNHLRRHMTSSFVLAGDIDMSDWAGQTGDPEGWLPVGNYSTQFTGTFDGGNHIISELMINRPTENYQGLFGAIGSGGAVRNLGMVDGEITGEVVTGSVAGLLKGNSVVENCYNTGNVTSAVAGSNVGGIVGRCENTVTVANCYNTGAVTGQWIVGGIVGVNDPSRPANPSAVKNCYNTGAVTGTSITGGVAGLNWGTVQNSYNTGRVTGASSYSGGVMGQNSGTVENCFFNTETTGRTSGYGYNGDGGTATNLTGLTTAQMLADNVLTGDMTMLDAAVWSKRDMENGCAFYPELKVFSGNPNNEIQAASKKSAAVLAYAVSLSQTGTYTFPGAVYGYGAQTPLTVTITNAGALSTGDLTVTLSGADVSGFTLSETSVDSLTSGAEVSFTVTPAAGLDVGTYTATVTVSNGNVPAQSFGVSFAVSRANQAAFTMDDIIKTYGDADFTLSAAGGSGTGSVSYEVISGDDVISISGETATILKAGAAEIRATRAGDDDYAAITATAAVTVNKKGVTITGLSVENKVYDGTDTATVTGTAALSANFDGSNLTVVTGGAKFTNKNAGNGRTVTFSGYSLSGSAAGNYTLLGQPATVTANITARAITITPRAGQSKAFGDSDPVFAYDFSPALLTGDSISGRLSRSAGEAPGTYAYVLGSLSAGGNYTLTLNPANTFEIIKPAENSSNISGKIIDPGNPGSITITLERGNTVVGVATITGSNPYLFFFKNVPDGIYNLVVDNGSHKVTQAVNVSGRDISDVEINMTVEKKQSVVEVKTQETPPTMVGGLPELFRDSLIYTVVDAGIVENGGMVEIKLVVEKKENPAEAAAIEQAAVNQTIGLYLDLSVLKSQFDAQGNLLNRKNLTNLGENHITVIFELPDELKGMDNLALFRIHDGVVEVLSKTPNADGETCVISGDFVTLKLCKFSTYAIGYKETGAPKTDDSSSAIPTAFILFTSALLAATAVKKGRKYRVIKRAE